MAALVDLETFRRHLKLDGAGTQEDATLSRMLDAATDVVLDYIARPDDEEWTATITAWTVETVPPRVSAAVLMQATELYGYRGDNDGPTRDKGDLSPMIKALLRRVRTPVVA